MSSEVPTITVNGSPLPAQPHLSPPMNIRPRSMPSLSSQSQSQASASSQSWTPIERRAYDFTYETFDYNNIVYYYRGCGVLVRAAPTYEEAIDIAIKEFPQLKSVPREDITICFHTASDGGTTAWRISASAWETSARKFGPRTKFDIAVRGEDKAAGPSAHASRKSDKAPPPPPYEPRMEIMERRRARARSHSPGMKTPSIVLSSQSRGSSFRSFFRRL